MFFTQFISKYKKFRRNIFNVRQGFTLIELLVVISIIGILATMIMLQLSVARTKTRDAKRITDINQIRVAIEMYFDANIQFPDGLTAANLGQYFSISDVPRDPTTGASYFYAYAPGDIMAGDKPLQYHLWTELERINATIYLDADIDSTVFTAPIVGNVFDASDPTTETCSAAYSGGSARDCVFDTGQK